VSSLAWLIFLPSMYVYAPSSPPSRRFAPDDESATTWQPDLLANWIARVAEPADALHGDDVARVDVHVPEGIFARTYDVLLVV
jgi:hypothetical protein